MSASTHISAAADVPTRAAISPVPTTPAAPSTPPKDTISGVSSSSLLVATTHKTLAVLQVALSLANNASRLGLVTLSKMNKLYLKNGEKGIGFFAQCVGVVNKLCKGASLKKIVLPLLNVALSGLLIYANFVKNKDLKKSIRLVSAAVRLLSMSTTLKQLQRAVQKKGISLPKLCKLCKKLSTITMSALTLASFATGGAVSLPLLLYSAEIMRSGCKAFALVHASYEHLAELASTSSR